VALMLTSTVVLLVAVAVGNPAELRAPICALLVVSFVLAPLLAFAHELAHAVTAVALTGQRVRIRMGPEPFRLRFALGRIGVDLSPGGSPAYCTLLEPTVVGARHMVLIALAGPAASLACGLALAWLARAQGAADGFVHWVLVFGAVNALFQTVITTIPIRSPPEWLRGVGPDSSPNDGYMALHALRSRGPISVGEHESRMTERTQAAILAAAEAARARGSAHLGSEHLLAGLVDTADGAAGRILAEAGVDTGTVHSQLASGDSEAEPEPTPAAERALGRALSALTLRGDWLIDAEHMLIGLTQEPDNAACRILAATGADPDRIREALLAALAA
jgi:hypothetical protein